MIKLLLLTGFLGAGKTTLLQKLLAEFRNEKIGVIINEFGQAGIDGTLVEKSGIPLHELNNGSIFCSCIKENFLSSLIALSKTDIGYLLIEASGLADPANMPQILETVNANAKRPYDYRGSICIVDAETFSDYYSLLPALHEQVARSGTVIVNKADLVEEGALADVIASLRAINPSAAIEVTTYCRTEIRKLVDELTNPARQEGESSNTPESRPKTVVLSSTDVLPAEELRNFLNGIKADAYRIKGFAETDEGIVYVSGLKNHLEILPWGGSFPGTKIVIISAVGIQMVSRIAKGLSGELKEKVKVSL
ncbi:MAG: GTP-binding protein [Bacillota bacterium]|jgi:G3E family GTPase|nr:GTP-binding protein [Bacillota bacterium]